MYIVSAYNGRVFKIRPIEGLFPIGPVVQQDIAIRSIFKDAEEYNDFLRETGCKVIGEKIKYIPYKAIVDYFRLLYYGD